MSVNLFKNSINGYNRSEVDSYILHVSKKHEQEKKGYERKIEILEAEITKLKNEKSEINKLLSEDEAIITAFKSKLEGECAEKKEAETKAEEASDEGTEIIEKSKRYDEISRQLGEIIINANADAAQIIRRAEDEAKEIKDRAAEDIRTEGESLLDKLYELFSDAMKKLSPNKDAEENGKNE